MADSVCVCGWVRLVDGNSCVARTTFRCFVLMVAGSLAGRSGGWLVDVVEKFFDRRRDNFLWYDNIFSVLIWSWSTHAPGCVAGAPVGVSS